MKFLPLLILGILVSCTDSKTSSSTTRFEASGSQTVSSRPVSPDPLPELINRTDSSLRPDDFDKSRIIVGPPKKAQIKIIPYNMYTAHMGFCGEMKTLAGALDDLAKYKKLLKESSDKDDITKFERRVKLAQDVVNMIDADMDRDFNRGSVELIEGWDKNIETLREANPRYTFVNSAPALDVKVKMTVKGLEKYPAHKMIRGLEDDLGIHETEEGLIMEFTPYGMKQDYWLSGYAACPLKEQKEIIIDLEFDV